MGVDQLLRGFIGIWQQDRIAIFATLLILLMQAYFAFRVWRRTWAPLSKERAVVDYLASRVSDHKTNEALQWAKKHGGARLSRAIAETLAPSGSRGISAGTPPEIALDRHRLLPDSYNARLDAAAPGLFTAFGITGTFVGLVFGFLRVEPANPLQSVAPLMGGMVVAFFNSLVGVGLSVIWSYQSRLRRHEFDTTCSGLIDAISGNSASPVFEDQLLAGVASVQGAVTLLGSEMHADIELLTTGIKELRSSTDRSSQELLGQLSTQLGESLKALVSTPFDQLNASVLAFDQIVRDTAAQQAVVRERMESAALQMVNAQQGLAGVVFEAKQFVKEFSDATDHLRANTEAASGVVSKAIEAGDSLAAVSQEIRASAEQYSSVTSNLVGALGGVISMAQSLQATAVGFAASTAQLEAAVATLRAASDETVEASVHAVQHELQRTMASVLEGLRDVGIQTIAAYENSSDLVSHAVDDKMSDLTDRLSAELTTLASRLPSEVEGLNQSMNQIRIQITKATRSMDDAVQQLAHRTPEALKAQLDAYDGALAKAMDRFSGTLLQWDGKISAIETFAAAMQSTTLDERRLGAATPAVTTTS